MNWEAKWLKPVREMGDVPPVYIQDFDLAKEVKQATLYITAMGVYEAEINGQRVGDFILAPGWTAYRERLQYQKYDVTDMLKETNEITVVVAKGWYHTHMMSWEDRGGRWKEITETPSGLLAQLMIDYKDGSQEIVATDESWKVAEGPVRFAEIYDGEIYDANIALGEKESVEIFEGPWKTLIPQEGEEVHTHERLTVADIFVTPKGETIVDFGQEITGYVAVTVNAKEGDVIDFSFAEVMDKEGNFYNENYRRAKCQYHYICKDGEQTFEPTLTFYGFRYIRINQFPEGVEVTQDCFIGVVVHSEMKRTGWVSCSNPMLNRLFDNVFWGQKGNFLDVPTDCPQRNERLGWTGDIQIFAKTACLNYDVEKFLTKWMADVAAEQWDDGYIGCIIPEVFHRPTSSAAWGDVATVCPWQVYLAYGNPYILEKQYECMEKWIYYISTHTEKENLWIGCCNHFGDWVALDAPSGSFKGSTRDEFVASAFYAYSTGLVIKVGKVLNKDVLKYEELYQNIIAAFRKEFPEYYTQTECILAAHFHLAKDCQATADQLAEMVVACGNQIKTGFVGTPYILHVLSDYGHVDLAYTLLLRTEYPSWLHPVTLGATTIWEHWDNIMENGEFWAPRMNSFNHYAFGSVIDWVYTSAAGIRTVEEYPGYAKVKIEPNPDERLDWLKAEVDTRNGRVSSQWKKQDGLWRYEITTPVEAEILIDNQRHVVGPGSFIFYSVMKYNSGRIRTNLFPDE